MKEIASGPAPRILVDEFGLELTRLQVDHGDVLILRVNPNMEPGAIHDAAETLRNALYGQGKDGCLVVVLSNGTELDVLDEAAMAEHGWVRAT